MNNQIYTKNGIECIEAERAALGAEGFRAACKAQAMQYIWREEHKGGDLDLKKAIDFLQYAINDSQYGNPNNVGDDF